MEFPMHQRSNVSRLESVKVEIAAMRSAHWPYHRIADWLRSEKAITVSKEAIRQFCSVRHIEKGGSSLQTVVRPARLPAPAAGKKFHFDDSKPIETRKNR
jgi:hypothetical protein